MSATVAQNPEPLMVPASIGTTSQEENPSESSANSTVNKEDQRRVRKNAPMKKVTFDLDLEIHTIPQRIPLYEKRPASHMTYPRGYHPQAFVPRPLDLRGRDRHLLGAATTRKIVDMFNLPNGAHNYPFSPKVISRSTRKGQQQNIMKYPPTNSYPPNFRQPKMSRAAFNLKQITAALGEHKFDEAVYEWDYAARARKQIGGSAASMASYNSGAKVSDMDASGRSHGNAIAAFSPSRIKTSPRSPPNPQTLSIDIHPSLHQGKQQLQPGCPTPISPHLSSNHLSLNSDHLQLNRGHLRTTNSRAVTHNNVEGSIDTNASSTKDVSQRASSQCSTIDTYVIAEVKESQKTAKSSPRFGSAGHRRRVITSPNKKTRSQVAWAGASPAAAIASAATPQMVSMIQQPGPGQPQWEVLAKPANILAS